MNMLRKECIISDTLFDPLFTYSIDRGNGRGIDISFELEGICGATLDEFIYTRNGEIEMVICTFLYKELFIKFFNPTDVYNVNVDCIKNSRYDVSQRTYKGSCTLLESQTYNEEYNEEYKTLKVEYDKLKDRLENTEYWLDLARKVLKYTKKKSESTEDRLGTAKNDLEWK